MKIKEKKNIVSNHAEKANDYPVKVSDQDLKQVVGGVGVERHENADGTYTYEIVHENEDESKP